MASTIPPTYSKLPLSLHRTLSTTDTAKCQKDAAFVILKKMSREEMCTVVGMILAIIALCVMIVLKKERKENALYVLKRQSCGRLPVNCAKMKRTPALGGPWTLAKLNVSSAIHAQEDSKETGKLADIE